MNGKFGAYSVETDPTNPDGVVVKAVSMATGRSHEMQMGISLNDFNVGRTSYGWGALIQDAFPTLSPSEREFLKTGMTDDEWADMFPEDEDEDDTPRKMRDED